MHYCFLTFGDLSNCSHLRARGLGNALVDQGVQVSFVADDSPQNRAFRELDPRIHVEWVWGGRKLGQFVRRRRAIKKLAPDYVEVLNAHPKTLLPLMRLRGPRVVAMWDESHFLKPYRRTRIWYELMLSRWLSRRAGVHLVAATALQQILEPKFGIRTHHFPHAAYLMDTPQTPSPYTERSAAFMGSLWPMWDHDILFHAADLLAQRGLRPPIYLMGSGPDEGPWRDFIREKGLDNVHMLGFVSWEEMWQKLRHAHVLLFPLRDTLINRTRCPSKTFAYAQAQRPIITCRVGELPHILEDKATYVPPTAEAFADAIQKAFEAPSLPDVPFNVQAHSWPARARTLIEILNQDKP